MADEERSPEEEFQEMLRQLMGAGGAGFDPAQLEQLRAMGIDPSMVQSVLQKFAGALGGDDDVSWDEARRHALHIANQDGLSVTEGQRSEIDAAFALAELWLGEATEISESPAPPRLISRGAWVDATISFWQELADPVATSIADALTTALREQVPEEMGGVVQHAGRLIRSVGGSLFATQFGQVIGGLSKEVVSGGDVGIPLMPDGEAAILPQNFADFGRDLGIPDDQLALYLSVRELAHARLFRHARWLRLHVISQIGDFARGLRVDTAAIEEAVAQVDPSSPAELRSLIESGALAPTRTPDQDAALARLENLLATVEGWVDVVTAQATSRLPSAPRIAEAVRRRRAVGGPAERALGSLVGLELRPRRMREAAMMWHAVTDAVGVAARDALWDYPDLIPTADDIDDPSGLIARLEAHARGEQPERDEIDEALDRLLTEDSPPSDDASGGSDDPRPV